MTKEKMFSLCRIAIILMLLPVALAAQEETSDKASQAADLAKQLSNPVADLVSVPFQFNWENGVGPNNDLRYVLNIQPVVPFSVSEDWNLIGRWIMPYVSQPSLGVGLDPVSGFSDIIASAFFSPAKSSPIWGIGPVAGIPTTTNPLLGSGKWSAGPTAVVLAQDGPWTYGFLANHLWSFANTGSVERDNVNQTYVQPFLSYATPGGVTLGINSESSANWEAPSDKWTVPISGSISKITKFGPFPMSIGASAGVYVAKPSGGPDWKLRAVFTLILPKKK